MEKDQLTRKLAVILHADVVGSTSLVQLNETLAHERIQSAFQQFSKTINSYGGTTRELRGDALVAEFERASDAVTAALAFQIFNEELTATLEDDIQPRLRIGISLGEVIIADDTITGAGVVLAQRLEQLAESGGVVVQGSVFETVPTRMPFDFDFLGEQVLKGFDNSVRAFSVRLQRGEKMPAPESNNTPQINESNEFQVSVKLSPESYEAMTGERLELPEKPSIAVLPFQNMSDDPQQEYFSDGISEDIITTLSRVRHLIVIARNSTFVYKGRAVDVRKVGEELGVKHVLEGSIRKSGDRLRITAQLVDTQSGDHIWAEKYDRKLDDIFTIQDEITRNIVTELQVKLGAGELDRTVASGTKSIDAWELMIRAGPLSDSVVRDDAMMAKQLAKQALEIDSKYSYAWSLLGWIYWQESVFKWSSEPEKSMQMAFDAAQKSLTSGGQDPEGYTLLGHVYLVRGDSKQAIEMCERAIEIAPGNSYGVALLANVLIDSGRVEEGIQYIKKAIRLCPFPPGWYISLLGTGYHLNGDNESAIYTLRQAIKREPGSHLPRLWLVSALVELGKLDEAHVVSKEVLDIEPNFSAVSWANSFKSKTHANLKDNLFAAGFRE
jgi:adenylate cyclase